MQQTSNYKHITGVADDGTVYESPCHVRGVVVGKVLGAGTLALHDAASVDTIAAGTNEQQTVTVSATGGTFTLSFAGQTTGNIAFGAASAVVQAALEALSNIDAGDIAVSGGTGPYTVTFQGRYAATDVPAMTGSGALLTGGANTVVVATTVPGVKSTLVSTIALDVARDFDFHDAAFRLGLVAIVSGTTDVTILWG